MFVDSERQTGLRPSPSLSGQNEHNAFESLKKHFQDAMGLQLRHLLLNLQNRLTMRPCHGLRSRCSLMSDLRIGV